MRARRTQLALTELVPNHWFEPLDWDKLSLSLSLYSLLRIFPSFPKVKVFKCLSFSSGPYTCNYRLFSLRFHVDSKYCCFSVLLALIHGITALFVVSISEIVRPSVCKLVPSVSWPHHFVDFIFRFATNGTRENRWEHSKSLFNVASLSSRRQTTITTRNTVRPIKKKKKRKEGIEQEEMNYNSVLPLCIQLCGSID